MRVLVLNIQLCKCHNPRVMVVPGVIIRISYYNVCDCGQYPRDFTQQTTSMTSDDVKNVLRACHFKVMRKAKMVNLYDMVIKPMFTEQKITPIEGSTLRVDGIEHALQSAHLGRDASLYGPNPEWPKHYRLNCSDNTVLHLHLQSTSAIY